ncbi:hypothetical protein PISMIDRAFT_16882 [Pisolithus microcarpus 441]|uniref:Uncharacterized protein n=1 Tax=Pisolithus microcarpus 441 TaxID=765257 RepID=A0A0C9YM56_9AGAM|nr:hypothetical protein BKA83DRAFT_16882 [Pisolithus microcarpus]KIK14959.1 hypothetical protein PISMIDRAFT_16882 [Pisolithus microcarpus 441]
MVMDVEEELDLEEEDEMEESKLEKEIEAEADTDPDVQALEEDVLVACAAQLNLDEEGSVCDDDGNIGMDLFIPPSSKGPDQPLPMSGPSSKILTSEGACVGHHGTTASPESEPDEDFSHEMAAVSSCSSDEPEPTIKRPVAAKSLPIRRPATMKGPLPVPTQTIPSIPKGPFPFVLSDKELQKVPPPGSSDPDGALKCSFAVDLQRVPGRTRRWTGFAGRLAPGAPRARFSIRELACAQDCTATPVANHLIEDPDLTNIGCAYMPDYDIIICRNVQEGKICGYGVPLTNLMTHCERAHHIPFCKRTGTSSGQKYYKPHQKEFLHRILARYPNIVATPPELRDVRMRPDQFGPILHIGDPIPGHMCTLCDYAVQKSQSTHTKQLNDHWNSHRKKSPSVPSIARKEDLTSPNSEKFRQCVVQSFDRDRTTALWLPVPPSQCSTGMPSTMGPQKTYGSLLASGLSRGSQRTGCIIDMTTVIPFFQQNGALDLIQQFDQTHIACLIALPTLQEPALCTLKAVVVDRFKLLCESIPKVNMLVRELLVAPKSGHSRMMDRFNCPAKDRTICSYALEEVRLLCLVLRCVQKKAYTTFGPSLPLGEKPQLVLTRKQLTATQALLKALLSHQQISHSQLMPLINDLLQDIYMPDNSFDMIENSFVNPANLYTCFRSMASQGGFEEPKRLTHLYAKIQFAMRLTIMDTVEQLRKSMRTTARNCSDEQLYDHFSLEMRKIINRWGSEEHISPLAFVRGWMRAMSRVARKAPSKNLIMWDMEGTRLTIQNHPVVLSEYFSAIQTSLDTLVKKVDGDVLFNIQFPPGSFDLPSEDTYNTKTPGFGLFSLPDDAAGLDAHPTAFFLEKLCEGGKICVRLDDQIVWQYDHLAEWLTAIAAAWSDTFILMHLLSLPARGTEATIWQHANSPASPRHLFLSSTLGTLTTCSNYNKTSATTGLHKYILRVIPFALATVITKLLRIVRPLEALALASQTVYRKEEVHDIHNTYVFVTMGKIWASDKLSAALRSWFTHNLRVPFGLNLHRHFAQALQRKFLSYEKGSNLAKAANRAMGHGEEVADLNYAREAGDLSMDVSGRWMMERVGADWLRLHHVDVGKAGTGVESPPSS